MTFFDLVKLNFKLFPVEQNGKKPLTKWREHSILCNEDRIKRDLENYPDCNFGIDCEASNLYIIDIDVKSGVDGLKNFKDFLTKNSADIKEIFNTFAVKTPSGGLHLYYYGEGKNSASKLAKGVDVRASGGYVVAPNSSINGVKYEIISNKTIAKKPDIFNLPEEKKNKNEQKIAEKELYIEEGERNNRLLSVAGSLRSIGLNRDAIEQALLVVNEDQTSSPISKFELDNIVSYVSNKEPSIVNTAIKFKEIEEKGLEIASVIGLKNVKTEKRKWVLYGRYLRRYLTVIIADGGVGKTTLSLYDCMCIACGKELSEDRTLGIKNNVLYYSSEDDYNDIASRIRALTTYYNIDENELSGFYFLTQDMINIKLAIRENKKLIENKPIIDILIKRIKELNIRLFVIDPFVAIHEADENNNSEIELVASVLRRIAKSCDCAVTVIHHSNKRKVDEKQAGDANSSRGASSLINACRIAYTLQCMTEPEAVRFGIMIDKRLGYVRLDNAKNNLASRCTGANWLHLEGVVIDSGDEIGVIKKVELQDVKSIKQEEENEEREDIILEALDDILDFDQEIELNKLNNIINEEYEHTILTKDLKEKINKMKIKSNLIIGEKKFDLFFIKEEGAKQKRFYVKCVKI